jgi:cysteine-rich repeat protein
MRSFIKKMLVPCITLALSALALQACSGDTDGGTKSCIPNTTQVCTCTGTDQGVQTCQASGVYNECNCGGATTSSSSSSGGGAGGGGGMGNCHNLPNTPDTCGNGMVEAGEECDDGNCVASDACNNNCKLPFCGDGVVQAPEVCDDGNGEVCPPDCGIQGSSSSSSSSSSGNMCEGKVVFAGLVDAQQGAFSYGGQIGLEAATAACQAIGAFGMCEYQQWKQIQTDPMAYAQDVTKLGMTIPPGTCKDVWLQRTTVATGTEAMSCPGGMSAPGPGGNCNNWNYKTGHRSNGEHVNICNMGGNITFDYKIDCDTIFDDIPGSPHVGAGMPCSPTLQIPCCFQLCVP